MQVSGIGNTLLAFLQSVIFQLRPIKHQGGCRSLSFRRQYHPGSEVKESTFGLSSHLTSLWKKPDSGNLPTPKCFISLIAGLRKMTFPTDLTTELMGRRGTSPPIP